MGICLKPESKPDVMINNSNIIPKFQKNDEDSLGPRISWSDLEISKINDIIIFVIGGPGSGKVGHSNKFVSEHPKEWIHINMSQIINEESNNHETNLQTATRSLLKLRDEMKVLSNIVGYLVSGFPRSMNDLTLYTEKFGRVDGVIYIDWKNISALEQQIEYGANLGEIDYEDSMKELKGFYLNSTPVIDYFEYKNLLHIIAGNRAPSEVYADFTSTVQSIQSSSKRFQKKKWSRRFNGDNKMASGKRIFSYNVIWVIGGPGSCKSTRTEIVVSKYFPNWHVVSLTHILLEYIQVEKNVDVEIIQNLFKNGESLPPTFILNTILQEMKRWSQCDGILIVGFPRNIIQSRKFESFVGIFPKIILLDCSELKLEKILRSRSGRLDDNVDSINRRLASYKNETLPLLKKFDDEHRLLIVDADGNEDVVLEELRKHILTCVKAFDENHQESNVNKSEVEIPHDV